jgi:hypothetical protein
MASTTRQPTPAWREPMADLAVAPALLGCRVIEWNSRTVAARTPLSRAMTAGTAHRRIVLKWRTRAYRKPSVWTEGLPISAPDQRLALTADICRLSDYGSEG